MIAAVVPVKRLADAKTRLSSRLSSAERSDLMLDLLERTVSALRASGSVSRLGLATPEPHLASSLNVESLPDGGSLNTTLRWAVEWARQIEAASLLIVPADLPLVTAGAVRTLAAAAGTSNGVVIASTRDGGTGALLLTPPDSIPPSFGPGSFQRHLSLAAERSLPTRVVNMDAFSLDLDTADDLDVLMPHLRLSLEGLGKGPQIA